jgi:hypothetical protein
VVAGAVALAATASDPEEGDISSRVVWRSSLAGAIGTGANVTATLAPGSHIITATITDSANTSAQAAITLNVTQSSASNTAPRIQITSPANGATIVEGAIALQATASDAEDGNLNSRIQWRSSLSGVLGVGGAITANLAAGIHTVTAAVTDSKNAGAQASIVLNITKRPTTANTAPLVRITSFSNGASVPAGSVTLTGTATDTQDGDISSKITWFSSISGGLGMGASITANLPVGTHTITAALKDSQGSAGQHSIRLNVGGQSSSNGAPSIQILAPAAGSTFSTTQSITFRGSASDPEDGDLSSNILWISYLQGVLGRGPSITRQLQKVSTT